NTYGVLADLRRELADSKAAVAEREEILRSFSLCGDSQRAWLLLEDYFEKLSLSRKDFPGADWWPTILGSQRKARLEALAFLFLRAKRSLPSELSPHANFPRFAQVEQASQERKFVQHLEEWFFPPRPAHLDAPRAALRVVCRAKADAEEPARHHLAVQFLLMRPRTGEKVKKIGDLLELTARAAHEQELFAPADWEFIVWLSDVWHGSPDRDILVLSDLDLLEWLARWGNGARLEFASSGGQKFLQFHGQVAELRPHLENGHQELSLSPRLAIPGG